MPSQLWWSWKQWNRRRSEKNQSLPCCTFVLSGVHWSGFDNCGSERWSGIEPLMVSNLAAAACCLPSWPGYRDSNVCPWSHALNSLVSVVIQQGIFHIVRSTPERFRHFSYRLVNLVSSNSSALARLQIVQNSSHQLLNICDSSHHHVQPPDYKSSSFYLSVCPCSSVGDLITIQLFLRSIKWKKWKLSFRPVTSCCNNSHSSKAARSKWLSSVVYSYL